MLRYNAVLWYSLLYAMKEWINQSKGVIFKNHKPQVWYPRHTFEEENRKHSSWHAFSSDTLYGNCYHNKRTEEIRVSYNVLFYTLIHSFIHSSPISKWINPSGSSKIMIVKTHHQLKQTRMWFFDVTCHYWKIWSHPVLFIYDQPMTPESTQFSRKI